MSKDRSSEIENNNIENNNEESADYRPPAADSPQAPQPLQGEGSSGQPDAPAQEEDPVSRLEGRVRALEKENASLKDQLLRSLADFENFRKRMFREREEAVRYANASLLSDLIEIIDDFERAIQSAAVSRDFESFHAGVSMIERQLVSMLERNWGLKRFQSAGEEFDPEKHQAIALEPMRGQEKPIVLEDYQKGYRLHDRILRPAKVKVSQPANEEAESNSGPEEP